MRQTDPGNGLFRTSYMETARAGYSYTALRWWNAGIDFGRISSRTISGITARYHQYDAGFGITRQLGRDFHALARFEVDTLHSAAAAEFNRKRTRFTLGVAWSPGETPLTLW